MSTAPFSHPYRTIDAHLLSVERGVGAGAKPADLLDAIRLARYDLDHHIYDMTHAEVVRVIDRVSAARDELIRRYHRLDVVLALVAGFFLSLGAIVAIVGAAWSVGPLALAAAIGGTVGVIAFVLTARWRIGLWTVARDAMEAMIAQARAALPTLAAHRAREREALEAAKEEWAMHRAQLDDNDERIAHINVVMTDLEARLAAAEASPVVVAAKVEAGRDARQLRVATEAPTDVVEEERGEDDAHAKRGRR